MDHACPLVIVPRSAEVEGRRSSSSKETVRRRFLLDMGILLGLGMGLVGFLVGCGGNDPPNLPRGETTFPDSASQERKQGSPRIPAFILQLPHWARRSIPLIESPASSAVVAGAVLAALRAAISAAESSTIPAARLLSYRGR